MLSQLFICIPCGFICWHYLTTPKLIILPNNLTLTQFTNKLPFEMLSPAMTTICWFSQLLQAYSCSRGSHISHCFSEVGIAFEFLPVVTVTITYFWDVTSYYVDTNVSKKRSC